MERAFSATWSSAPPTSVREDLVVLDADAWHLVLTPVGLGERVGTWHAAVPTDLAQRLPSPARHVDVDVVAPRAHDADVELAEQLRAACLEAPSAVASFTARGRRVEGRVSVTTVVVGVGSGPVRFTLAPDRCRVLLLGADGPVGWHELPPVSTGFITPEATGLGGLHSAAVVKPGDLGALTVTVPLLAGATAVCVEVAGLLLTTLPDVVEPAPFRVRTPAAPLG